VIGCWQSTGAVSSSACSRCDAGSYSTGGTSQCRMCSQGSYTTAPGADSCMLLIQSTSPPIPNPGSTSPDVVEIFQFVAPYEMAEINDSIMLKMKNAVANLLDIASSEVVLKFAPVSNSRRSLGQQTGVLVTVCLSNTKGVAANYISLITQDGLNSKMIAQGLGAARLVNTKPPGCKNDCYFLSSR
jgi:hypothetical protein